MTDRLDFTNPLLPEDDKRVEYLRYKLENGLLYRTYDMLTDGEVTTSYYFQEDVDVDPQVGDEVLRCRTINLGADNQQTLYDTASLTQEIIDYTDPSPNVAPTDIALTSTAVSERAGIGDCIGCLSTFDPNVGDTHSYSIVSDPDDKFSITGNNLRLKNLVNHDTAGSHDVTVRSTDQSGLYYDKLFTIYVYEEEQFVNDKSTLFQGDTFDHYMKGPASSSILTGSGSFTANLWLKKDNPSFTNNYSLTFNGTDKKVDTTADYSDSAKLTVSAWFYRDTATRMDISQTDDLNAQRIKVIRNETGIYLVAGPAASISVADSATGEWQHIVGVYDGTQATASDRGKIYLNGALQTLTGSSGTLPTTLGTISDNKLSIGYDAGSARYSEGKIDEVSVWDEALTLAQIQEIYNNQRPTNLEEHSAADDLLNWWRMGDELTGTTVPDQIGSDDGTLVDMDSDDRGTALEGGDLKVFKSLLSLGGIDANTPKALIEWNQSDTIRTRVWDTVSEDYIEAESENNWGDNEWHMVTLKYDSLVFKAELGIDGTVKQAISPTAPVTGDREIYLATADASDTTYYDGFMDEVSVWSDSMNIDELYAEGYAKNLEGESGLEAWWRMGDAPDDYLTANGVVDRTGNEYHLTAYNMTNSNIVDVAVEPVPTYENLKSLPFNGIDQTGDTGVSTDLTGSGDFSVSVWYKGSAPSYIVSQAHSLTPSYSSDWIIGGGGGIFWMRSKTLGDVNDISDDEWYHIVLAWDSTAGTYEGYVNGASIGTSAVVTGYGGAGNVSISTRGDFTTSFNQGKVDETSLWDKKLDATEVAELYNGGSPLDILEHSAVANNINWWRMGEDTDDDQNTVIDQRGSSNITLNNFLANPYSSDVPV